MSVVLSLEQMALTASGPTLSMSIHSGQSLALVGPAASGKTHFLHVIAEVDRPLQGHVKVRGEVGVASADGVSRRSKVGAVLPKSDVVSNGLRVSEVLYRLRLADFRNTPIGELSPGQMAAYELLSPLLSNSSLLLIDGQLDLLDPWTLTEALAIIRMRQSQGLSLVVATVRPDLIPSFDAVVVLKDKQVRFAGPIEDLRRLGPPHTVQVSTENQQGVRALVAPFQVSVEKTADGMKFKAEEGQELAARLLVEGYGDVQFVVNRPATLEESLLSLF